MGMSEGSLSSLLIDTGTDMPTLDCINPDQAVLGYIRELVDYKP